MCVFMCVCARASTIRAQRALIARLQFTGLHRLHRKSDRRDQRESFSSDAVSAIDTSRRVASRASRRNADGDKKRDVAAAG